MSRAVSISLLAFLSLLFIPAVFSHVGFWPLALHAEPSMPQPAPVIEQPAQADPLPILIRSSAGDSQALVFESSSGAWRRTEICARLDPGSAVLISAAYAATDAVASRQTAWLQSPAADWPAAVWIDPRSGALSARSDGRWVTCGALDSDEITPADRYAHTSIGEQRTSIERQGWHAGTGGHALARAFNEFAFDWSYALAGEWRDRETVSFTGAQHAYSDARYPRGTSAERSVWANVYRFGTDDEAAAALTDVVAISPNSALSPAAGSHVYWGASSLEISVCPGGQFIGAACPDGERLSSYMQSYSHIFWRSGDTLVVLGGVNVDTFAAGFVEGYLTQYPSSLPGVPCTGDHCA